MISRAVVLLSLCAYAALAPSRPAHAENIVCFEAESADTITPPMLLVDCRKAATNDAVTPVKDSSGDKYLEIPKQRPTTPLKDPDDKNCAEAPVKGCASITIEIPADGEYHLWGRVWWTDECRNSFTLSIDNKPGFTFGDDRTFKCWHWIKALKKQKLTKGKHTLLLKQREPGVRIDQMLFVDDHRYVPVGIEEPGTRK